MGRSLKRAKRLYLLSVVLTSLACGVDQDVLVRANATPGTAGATSATAGHAGGAAGPSAGGTAGATGGAGASAGGSLGGGGALGTGGASAGAPVFSPPFAAGSTVTAGQSHTCALWAGVTWCWGENSRGEVGVGDLVPRLTPARLDGLPPLASISAGDHLSVARRAADGRVYAWGANSSGQLGTSDFSDRSAPSLIAGLASTGLVVAGYAHACALDTFARLRCWGENGEGQLGQDDVYPGTNAASPLPVAGSDWRAVSAGQGHTCALRASGELWCWGRNSGGQLALGAGSAVQVRVPTVAATAGDLRTLEGGQGSTCAVASDHAVRCWGDVPVAAVGAPAPTPLTSPTTVADSGREVSVDTFHVCMIELDGSLWCWGRNAEGQLGLGDELDRAAPVRIDGAVDWSHVAVGRFHTCAQKLDGTMWCTGDNFGGQLGVGDTQRRKLFTQVILP